jgi:tyrosine-specific transport protein
VFTSIIGSILTFASETIISNMNNLFVFLVLLSFIGLVTIGLPAVNIENLLFCDTNAILKTVPVMLVALVYHNIVPVICSKLKYDRKQIIKAITIGSAIPLVMFLVWNFGT